MPLRDTCRGNVSVDGADGADQQHALLSQDEVYGGLVSRFFEQRSYPKLAWLHHVASGRYGAAARDLGDVLQVEEKLGHKSVSLIYGLCESFERRGKRKRVTQKLIV